jgi:predicted nucleic acid-binding protein
MEVSSATWLTVVATSQSDVVDALLAGGLHRGESEAIAIAIERQADRLLIDERQGRIAAESMGVAIIGSVGILIAAKTRGDINAVAPMLDALRASGLWLSDVLVARVLLAVGE